MGAWGYKVFDNDTSCDFMYLLKAPVEKILKRKRIHKYQYDDYRAAAEFIIKMSPCYIFDDEEILDPLVIVLTHTILADQDWINSWNDKDKIRKDVRRQITSLKKISKRTKERFQK